MSKPIETGNVVAGLMKENLLNDILYYKVTFKCYTGVLYLYQKGIIFSHSVLSMMMLYCVAPATPVHPIRIMFPMESTTLRFVTRPTDCSTKDNSRVNILHERHGGTNKNTVIS